jgi:hypothetical protein
VLPVGVGESTMFPKMVDALQRQYGQSGMFDVIDADAGLTSLSNANYIDGKNLGYIFGLKGNQPELYAEAKALLLPMVDSEEPEARTPFENRNGKKIRRSLWRTNEMAGIENSVGKWTHLRQTWLVHRNCRPAHCFCELVVYSALHYANRRRSKKNYWMTLPREPTSTLPVSFDN